MPRGGRRVGAGRKPKPKPPKSGAVVLGMDGRRQEPDDLLGAAGDDPVLSHPPELLATPPRDLSAAEKKVWRRLAPSAIAAQTLTPETVPGFRMLVEQFVVTEAVKARLATLGADASADTLKLLRIRNDLVRQLNTFYSQFKLTGFGKPAEAAGPPNSASGNPWSEVAR